MEKQAFVLRVSPSGDSQFDEAKTSNQILIGWSTTEDKLFKEELTRDNVKKILRETYSYVSENILGKDTGVIWHFFKTMKEGDYVLVPDSMGGFLVGVISSDVRYMSEYVSKDSSFRRDVKWLNNENPIKRSTVSSALQSRLKYQGTLANATDLLQDIENAINNNTPTFESELQEQLKAKAKEVVLNSKNTLNDIKFERLLGNILKGLGASDIQYPSKSTYKGSIADIDVCADFEFLGIRVLVQTKYHSGKTSKYAAEQLIKAKNILDTDDHGSSVGNLLFWAVTSAEFDQDAQTLANNNDIRLINGDELAEMIVKVGIDKIFASPLI